MMRFIFVLLFLVNVFIAPVWAADFTVVPNIAYGSDTLQKIDIYSPKSAKNAPVLVMVHGGAWAIGDKNNAHVVRNKGEYWLSKGFVFVSINYRLLPKADPLEQAKDIGSALVFVQKSIARWGGDSNKIILMGHSAGAHLAALIAADPSIVNMPDLKPWKGTVLLDSAALDVPFIMQHRHFSFYDDAFGKDPAFWEKTSPIAHLTKQAAPFLLVCSSQRFISCPQAEKFADKAKTLGIPVQILPQNLTHEEINDQLGLSGDYTKAVDEFISKQIAK